MSRSDTSHEQLDFSSHRGDGDRLNCESVDRIVRGDAEMPKENPRVPSYRRTSSKLTEVTSDHRLRGAQNHPLALQHPVCFGFTKESSR